MDGVSCRFTGPSQTIFYPVLLLWDSNQSISETLVLLRQFLAVHPSKPLWVWPHSQVIPGRGVGESWQRWRKKEYYQRLWTESSSPTQMFLPTRMEMGGSAVILIARVPLKVLCDLEVRALRPSPHLQHTLTTKHVGKCVDKSVVNYLWNTLRGGNIDRLPVQQQTTKRQTNTHFNQ